VLVGSVHDRLNLKQIIHEVADEHAWQIIRLAIQLDQGYLFIFIHANPYTVPFATPWLVKGRSSHDGHEEFPHLRKLPSLWTCSCFLSRAGNVSQEIIQRFIERRSKM
jgi:putative transposase